MFGRVISIVSLAITCTAAFADVQYSVSPLGSHPDGSDTVPTLINNSQTVIGAAIVGTPGERMPFFLSTALPEAFAAPPTNTTFSPAAMNDCGTAAGILMASQSNPNAPFYSAALYQNGRYISLPAPDSNPMNDYRATVISNSGVVLGLVIEDNSQFRAVVWTNGQPAFLDSDATESNAANAINDKGWMAGAIRPASSNVDVPVIWQDNIMTTISLPNGSTSGSADAINNSGQVLVNYFALVGDERAEFRHLIWKDGFETLLPQFSDPNRFTHAYDMNESGIVVGESAAEAVVWRDGQIYDLNDLIDANSGWVLTTANSINDAGEIVGYGALNGVGMPFLLAPISGDGFDSAALPEPTTLPLLAFAALNVLRRRSAQT